MAKAPPSSDAHDQPEQVEPGDPGFEEALSFEQALAELETIVAGIEAGEQSLETSMQHHRRGRALLHRCGALLDAAQQELEEAAVDDLPDAAGDST